MSTAPRTAGPEPTRDQISFCRQLFAGMTGAKVELSTIDGDPDDRNNHVWKYGTRRYTSPAGLARAIAERAAAGLNVYTSVSAAHEAGPRYAPIIDSPVIFVDDAPERGPLPWSMYMQTSPDSGHGYIILDTPIPADARVRLAQRLAAACGGDPSGVDAQQLVRPPGSVNGKEKCKGYRAWLKIDSGKRYTVAEVEAATRDAPAHTRGTSPTGPIAVDPAEVEAWRWVAAHIELYVNPKTNIPYFVERYPCSQTYKMLAGLQRWLKKGEPTGDPSRIRWHVAFGQYKCFGCPRDVLGGILLHYGNFEHLGGDSSKGTADIVTDIARILGKLAALHPDVTPRADLPRVDDSEPAEMQPDTPRRRKGRPRRGSADEYFDWLAANVDSTGRVIWTRRECAEHWQVSIPTVDRWEINLRKRGLMERHTSKDRRYSWIVLSSGAIKNAPEPTADVPEPVLGVFA